MSHPDEYLATVARLEPEIVPIDTNAAMASIAISLKRIADVLEGNNDFPGLGRTMRTVEDFLRFKGP